MNEFKALLDRVRDGSEDAAWELLDVYGPHVMRVIRRTLSQQMRTRYDSTDFAQAVWASFFNNRAQVCDLDSPDELVRLLCGITRNKLRLEFRRNVAVAKRSIDREKTGANSCLSDMEVASSTATPSAFAIARERWQQLESGLSARDRMILKLRYQGFSNLEIASQVSVTTKTVTRVVDRLLGKLNT